MSTGEAVFNTVLSGYQEVITDPSYAGQIIAFTYPHIGNYGVNPTDDEAPRPHCRGVVVRDLADAPSSAGGRPARSRPSSTGTSVPGITGVDTRRLTRHLRDCTARCRARSAPPARPTWPARRAPRRPTDGRDLVTTVTTSAIVTRGSGPYRVVAYDFGVKEAMLRQLERSPRSSSYPPRPRPTRSSTSSRTGSSSPTARGTRPPCPG